MSTTDEAASTTDYLGSVYLDVTPGAEPWWTPAPVPLLLLLLLLLLLVWRLCRLLIEKGLGLAEALVFGG